MHSFFARPAERPAVAASRQSSAVPSAPRVVRFTRCRVLRDHELREGEDLWVRDGVIADPKSLFWEGCVPDEVVDCENRIVAPGLIDLQ